MKKRKRSSWRLMTKQNRNILQTLGIADQYNRQRKKKIFRNDSISLEKHNTYFFSRRNLLMIGYRELQNPNKPPINLLKNHLWEMFRHEYSNRLYFERIFKMIIARFLSAAEEDCFDQKYRPVLKQCLLPPIADKMFFIFRELVLKFYESDKRPKQPGAARVTLDTKAGKGRKQKRGKKSRQKLKSTNNTNIMCFFSKSNPESKKSQGLHNYFHLKYDQKKGVLVNSKRPANLPHRSLERQVSNLTEPVARAAPNRTAAPFSFKKYFYVDCMNKTVQKPDQRHHAIVINGDSGCGKRSFVRAFCQYHDYQLEDIDFCAFGKVKEVISKFGKATNQNDIQIKLRSKNSLSQLMNKEAEKNEDGPGEPDAGSNCPIGVSSMQIESPARCTRQSAGIEVEGKATGETKQETRQGDCRRPKQEEEIRNGLRVSSDANSLVFPDTKDEPKIEKKKIFLCTNLRYLVDKDYYKSRSSFLRGFGEFLEFVKKSNYLFVFCFRRDLNFLFDNARSWVHFVDMDSFACEKEFALQVKMIVFIEKLLSSEKLELRKFRAKETSNEEFKYVRIFRENLAAVAEYVENNREFAKKPLSESINEFMIDQFLRKMGRNRGKIFSNLQVYWRLFVHPSYRFKIECLESKSQKSLSMFDFFPKREVRFRDIKYSDVKSRNRDYLLESFIRLNHARDGDGDKERRASMDRNAAEIPFEKEKTDKMRMDFNTSKCMFIENIGYKDLYSVHQLKTAHKILFGCDVKYKERCSHLKAGDRNSVQNFYLQEIFENNVFEKCRKYASDPRFLDSQLEESLLALSFKRNNGATK